MYSALFVSLGRAVLCRRRSVRCAESRRKGKQEENVECRKSLSKNTRLEKMFGAAGRLSDSFSRHKKRKIAEIPFHSHSCTWSDFP